MSEVPYSAPPRESFSTSAVHAVAVPPDSISVALERGLPALEAIADQWRDLCSEGFTPEPFFRPEWISTYCHAFAPNQELLLLTARLRGRLRAVLPLMQVVEPHRGIPVRQLRAAGNVHSCRFDAACAPGEEGARAARAIWERMATIPGWDIAVLHSVPQGGAAEIIADSARKSGFPVSRTSCVDVAYLTIDERAISSDFSEALPLRSHFRSNFRRRLRQAREKYAVSLEHVGQADPSALDKFFRLEASGWKGAAGSAILSSATTRMFYRDVADIAEKYGHFDLWFLNFDARPIAAHFGITYGNVHYALKIAHDESWKHFAPGHMLLGAMLPGLAKRGVAILDFIGPIARWEAEWTRQVRPHFTHYIYRRNLFGFGLYVGDSYLIPRLKKLRRQHKEPVPGPA